MELMKKRINPHSTNKEEKIFLLLKKLLIKKVKGAGEKF